MPALSVLVLATTVAALPLPPGFTIRPEGERRLMAVNARGTVVATMSIPKLEYLNDRAIRWRGGRRAEIFAPLPGAGHSSTLPAGPQTLSALGPDDAAYVEVARTFGGGYSGVSTETQRWDRRSIARVEPGRCATSGGDRHVSAVDARGRLAVTVDTEGVGTATMTEDIAVLAPHAVVADGSACTVLGRAILRALRGPYAAGYRGYLDDRPAPTILDRFRQTFRAVRWYGGTERELGIGVGLAVNAHGMVAGASAPPADHSFAAGGYADAAGVTHTYRYDPRVPRARVWDAGGNARDIAPDAVRSVAYEVGDDDTVVGMLQARDGKHYAFVWRDGRLQRLDDLPHPSGWRFESAYTIAPDGAIAGIGTFRGVATAFLWRR